MLTCRLSNGQFDEYPLAWAIPIKQALLICGYFIQTGELYGNASYPFADGDGHLAGR